MERELGGIREEGEVGRVRLVSGGGGLLSFVGLDEGEEFVLGEYGDAEVGGLSELCWAHVGTGQDVAGLAGDG